MVSDLEQVRAEVLGSRFAGYLDRPTVERLYGVKLRFGRELAIHAEEMVLQVPTFAEDPVMGWPCIRKVVAQGILGDFYHLLQKKSAADIVYPKVERAFGRLKTAHEPSEVGRIFEEEMGGSAYLSQSALLLHDDLAAIESMRTQRQITADNARESTGQAVEEWLQAVESGRSHAMAYIFTDSMPRRDWAAAQGVAAMVAVARQFNIVPYLDAWFRYKPEVALRRIADFDVPQPWRFEDLPDARSHEEE